MSVTKPRSVSNRLEAGLRRRRLWYHDIDVGSGLRTRFAGDYDVSPVLRAVDRVNNDLEAWLDAVSPCDLRGRRVLDLGCADGLHSFRAARRGAKRIVGVERNRYNFEHAVWLRQVLALEQVEFRWGGVERQMPGEPFDLVFCLGLLYHLVDPLGTLRTIRERCAGRLVLTSAIDLPDADGAPLARLDRYATGAHGVWAFNVPMVRQLLTTTGFEIMHEKVNGRDGAGGYFVVAALGPFRGHHIFEEVIDQEFPVALERRRRRVRAVWRALAQRQRGAIALFGAGTHTPWLLEQVADIPGVTVECVLDDRIPPTATVAGLPVRRPGDVNPESLSAVVLSSWHQTEVLRQRAAEVFGDRVERVSLAPPAASARA